MSDKVQLIKEEIKRRISQFEAKYPKDLGGYWNDEESAAYDCAEEYKNFLLFIDSLPEEPKCIYNRTLEERKKFCKYCSAACDIRIEEEPETEDLIEEIDKIWKTCNPIDEGMGVETANIHIEQFDDIARHFAEWQKQQMKEALQTEYEKGRFDMREEMVKDAVDGEVAYQIGSSVLAPTDVRYKVMSDRVYIPNVKLGDKVKIIIVKNEQQ